MSEPNPSDPALPAWLETCPPWCAGLQCREEHPEDRAHQSVLTTVPVIVYDRTASLAAGHEVAEASELTLGIVGRTPSGDTWIVLAAEDQASELTLESAQRLHRHLTRLLDTFRP